jgi:hypothetical protein
VNRSLADDLDDDEVPEVRIRMTWEDDLNRSRSSAHAGVVTLPA